MGRSVSKLSKDDLLSLKQNTQFDKRELQQWYKGFLRDCPSGQLSEEEFAKIFKQFFPFGDPTEYCHYMMKAFDTDNSKYIDFKEFITALSVASRGSNDNKIEWCFKIYDQKKQGEVNYDDVYAVVRASYKMVGDVVGLPEQSRSPEARADQFFIYLNKDKTKDTINLEEFKKLVKMDSSIMNALNSYEGLL